MKLKRTVMLHLQQNKETYILTFIPRIIFQLELQSIFIEQKSNFMFLSKSKNLETSFTHWNETFTAKITFLRIVQKIIRLHYHNVFN